MTNGKNGSGDNNREARMASEVNSLLEERIAKLNKSFKVGLVGGGVICLVVIIYLSVLYSGFSEVVEAETLADFVSGEASLRIPQMGAELESNLTQEAPAILGSIKNAVLNDAIPSLGDMAEEKMYSVYEEVFKVAPQVLVDEVFAETVKAEKATILAAAKQEGGLGDPKALAAFEQKLARGMQARSDRKGKGQISSELKQSVAALNDITAKLKTMAGKKDLTEEETAVSGFVSAWWTFLGSEQEKMSGAEVKIVKDNLGSSTREVFEGIKEMARE